MVKNEINNELLVERLKGVIYENLYHLIDSDFVLWDLPYHKNIGDTLIWQGTIDFLKTTPYKMLDSGSRDTANFGKVNSDTIICLHGGGNWGDIYRSSQDFRNKVISKYPHNKIIILPQSIYYKNQLYLDIDKNVLNNHSNLVTCVRDRDSYKIAQENFHTAEILLLPDMAFCIDLDWLSSFKLKSSSNKCLYLNRVDVENLGQDYRKYIKQPVYDMSDWPTFNRKYYYPTRLADGILYLNRNTFKYVFSKPTSMFLNAYFKLYIKNKLIKVGTSFLSQYDVIYTTRLHVCILSILLNRKTIVLDNNYGKLSSFYSCWLSEISTIELISK